MYEQIKEQVTAREAAEYYGHQVNRSGMMICPFHPDRNPSMKVDKNFYCFGCHEKGDVIRFVSRRFGLPPHAAAEKLIRDMGLKVTVKGRPPGWYRAAPAAVRQNEQQRREAALRHAHGFLCDYLRQLEHWAQVYAPRTATEPPDARFLEAMRYRDDMEHLLDLLQDGTAEEQAFAMLRLSEEAHEIKLRAEKLRSASAKTV